MAEIGVKTWLAIAAGGDTVRLIPDLCPHGGPDVFVKANDYAALEAQLAEAQKDAERYRWLRQERYMFREGAAVTCDTQIDQVALWVKCPITNDPHEVDAAIDAARSTVNSEPKQT